jgi:hypothetical protein
MFSSLPSRVTVAVIGPEISERNSILTLCTSGEALMKLIAAWYAWFKVAMIRFLISSPSRVGRLPINLAVM